MLLRPVDAPPVARGDHGELIDGPPTPNARARTSTSRRPAPTPPTARPEDPITRPSSRRGRSSEIQPSPTTRSPPAETSFATPRSGSRRPHPPTAARQAEAAHQSEASRRSHHSNPSPPVVVQPPIGRSYVSSPEGAGRPRNNSLPPSVVVQPPASVLASYPEATRKPHNPGPELAQNATFVPSEVTRRPYSPLPGDVQLRHPVSIPSLYAEATPQFPDATRRHNHMYSPQETIQIPAPEGRRRRPSASAILTSQAVPQPLPTLTSPFSGPARPPPSLISSLPEVTQSPEPFVFPFPRPRPRNPPDTIARSPEATRSPDSFTFPFPAPRPPSPPKPHVIIQPPEAVRSPEVHTIPFQPPPPPSLPYVVPPEATRRPTYPRTPETHIPLPPPEHRFSLPTIVRRVKKLRKPTLLTALDTDEKPSIEQEEVKPVFQFSEVLPSQRRSRVKRNYDL